MTDTEPKTLRFALLITNNGRIVNNTVHSSRGDRRDACVKFLHLYGYIRQTEVDDILLSFGGADPDAAVDAVSKLFKNYGLDVYLEDRPVPELPVRGVPCAMYSILQSYDNSAQNVLVHFPTPEARAEHMRRQLNSMGAAVPPDDTFTDDELRKRVQRTLNGLLDQNVTVHLATSLSPNWL